MGEFVELRERYRNDLRGHVPRGHRVVLLPRAAIACTFMDMDWWIDALVAAQRVLGPVE